jgi:DNA-directed RNA polymerase specialized sigma24 family protein
MPANPPVLPPELASLSKTEMRDAYQAVAQLAFRITRSTSRTDELVQTTFERLLTTRRWDPEGGPLLHHLMGVVKSLLSISYKSKAKKHDEIAHDGFHREVVGESAGSVEDAIIEHADREAEHAGAAAELDELVARVARHPDATRVLRLKIDTGIDDAAEIAVELDLPVTRVYRINEVLKYHLERIRAGKRHEEHEEGEEGEKK